jgi:hypothetical protein
VHRTERHATVDRLMDRNVIHVKTRITVQPVINWDQCHCKIRVKEKLHVNGFKYFEHLLELSSSKHKLVLLLNDVLSSEQ